MALGLTAQANIAYKNLLGKSLTYLVNGVNVEGTGIFFNVTSNNIWLAQLPSSATQAVASGYAVQVTGSMSLIVSANGYAYNLLWPITPPSGTDPVTSTSFAYNTGSLIGINAGNVVTNAIPDSYGSAYSIYISGVSGGQIFPSDARNWVYQYNSGIYFQENAFATPNPSTASVYVYIGPTLQSQPNAPFTLTSSTSQITVGGLNSGSSFNSVSTNNILLNMLYPSTQPNIISFSMSGISVAYEVGNGILSGSYNLNWVISNTASLSNNNVYIIGYNNAIIGPLSNSGPYSYTFGSSLTYNTLKLATWTMSVLVNTGIRISSTFSIGWYYAMYYGSSTQSLLITPNSLQNSNLSTNAAGSYALAGTTGSYKYIAIPDLYPKISSITWNGLPVALADSTDGYTWSANNLSYNFLPNYANIYGITYSYKIYRSKYMLAATMSNVIIS
jgi:hypothetical protein